MRINGLLAPAWQLLQPFVSSSKAAINCAAVPPFNHLSEPLFPWIDDGLDHLGDRNPVKGRMQPCCVLEAFLDLVNLIGSQAPVAILTGKPKLGVAQLG